MSRLKILLNGNFVEYVTLEPGSDYSFGRSNANTVPLEAHPGISRNHFRVKFDGQIWRAEVVSKFAELWHNGMPSESIELTPNLAFRIPPYDFIFEEKSDILQNAVGAENLATPRTEAVAALRSVGNAAQPTPPEDFDGDDGATSIGSVQLKPFVRIEANGETQEIALEGGPWLAGRDESCAIFLNSSKVSRKQFEISQSAKGWFVKDLGSSNGTYLNGKMLPANELFPLRSGDQIRALKIEIRFETRDVHFADRAANLPAVILPFNAMPSTPHSAHNQGNAFPAQMPPHFSPVMWEPNEPYTGPNRNKKIFYAAIAVVFVLGIWLFIPSKQKSSNTMPVENSEFQKLPAADRHRIENTYRLAQEFYVRHQFELAMGQLDEIHKVLPHGYEHSLELADSISNARHAQEEEESLRRQREQLLRQEAQVREIVTRCKPIADRVSDIEQIKTCLDQALQLKPDDIEAQKELAEVQSRHDSEMAAQASRQAYHSSVSRVKSLYEKAEKLRAQNKEKEALIAYQAFLRSGGPDPEGLKGKAQSNISTIKQNMNSRLQAAVEDAQQKLDRNDPRGALMSALQVQKMDPENEKAREIGSKAQRQLNVQLQALYADSVVFENFGQLDAAKEKWQKILEIDRPHGEYWVKARNKLNSYIGN